MAKLGRPTDYREDYCDKLIEFMSDGRSITAFAADLCVTRGTLYKWAQEHEMFSDAIKIGKLKSQAWWESLHRESANGDKDKNISAIIFCLKTRFHYTEPEPTKLADVPEDSFDKEFSDMRVRNDR